MMACKGVADLIKREKPTPLRTVVYIQSTQEQESYILNSLSSGADPGVDWVASHPPLWGRVSLKLRKGTKLSLRRFCL